MPDDEEGAPSRGGSRTTVPEVVLARQVAQVVGADRVALSLTSGVEHRAVVRGSDPVLVRLGDHEQSVGEGPSLEVLRSGRLLVVDDVHAEMGRWPVLLTSHRLPAAVRSLLVAPLGGRDGGDRDGGAHVVGLLALSRPDVRPFSVVERAIAGRLADLVSILLQARALDDLRDGADDLDDRDGGGPRGGAGRRTGRLDEVVDPAGDVLPLAVGQLMVREDVSEAEALRRLEHRAFSSGRSVYDAARDVVGPQH